jgi:uncharacterized protein
VDSLARSDAGSYAWREDFIQTFLERDLGQLSSRIPAPTIRRFWTMPAHYSGGNWNASEVGGSLGEAHTTVRRRLDVLAGALVVRIPQPWHTNLAKRQVKSPKVYIRDSGLLHTLHGVRTLAELQDHPKAGTELDLLVNHRGRWGGVEMKYSDARSLTPSMGIAMKDLRLDHLLVVYPGALRYKLAPRIDTLSLQECLHELS